MLSVDSVCENRFGKMHPLCPDFLNWRGTGALQNRGRVVSLRRIVSFLMTKIDNFFCIDFCFYSDTKS